RSPEVLTTCWCTFANLVTRYLRLTQSCLTSRALGLLLGPTHATAATGARAFGTARLAREPSRAWPSAGSPLFSSGRMSSCRSALASSPREWIGHRMPYTVTGTSRSQLRIVRAGTRRFTRCRRMKPNASMLARPTSIAAQRRFLRSVSGCAIRSSRITAYRQADVFSLPSRQEPLGLAVVEAMFFSLPCVTTDIWAMPEMVVDGVTGFTVPPDAPDLVADRLCQILENPCLARTMGAAGRA